MLACIYYACVVQQTPTCKEKALVALLFSLFPVYWLFVFCFLLSILTVFHLILLRHDKLWLQPIPFWSSMWLFIFFQVNDAPKLTEINYSNLKKIWST